MLESIVRSSWLQHKYVPKWNIIVCKLTQVTRQFLMVMKAMIAALQNVRLSSNNKLQRTTIMVTTAWENKKSSSLVSVKSSLLMPSLQNVHWRIGIHIKNHTKLLCCFFIVINIFCRFKLVLVIVFWILNKFNGWINKYSFTRQPALFLHKKTNRIKPVVAHKIIKVLQNYNQRLFLCLPQKLAKILPTF